MMAMIAAPCVAAVIAIAVAALLSGETTGSPRTRRIAGGVFLFGLTLLGVAFRGVI